jgi:hypothetical protein
MGTVANPAALDLRETMAADSTKPSAPRNKCPIHQSSIMIEVPLVRILEEPGVVILHAGIGEGGVGELTPLT